MSQANDVLSGLTADRLEELAAMADGAAASDEVHATASGPTMGKFWQASANNQRQIAAALRALAGAERAMRLETVTLGVGRNGDGFYVGYHNGFPTLLAALASVAKQEEPNDA